jgi:hypothetical protein
VVVGLPKSRLPVQQWKVAAIVCFIAAIVTLVFLYLRPKSLQAQAREILTAVEKGDGSTLYAYAYDHEKRELELSPEKISAVYSQLILPRFATFKPVGPVQTMINQDGSQAIAWQHMVDSNGHSFDLDVSPWATPHGAQQMVMARLMTAWIVEYRLLKGKPMDTIGCLDGKIEGLLHDKAALRRIGINGFVTDNPGSKICTLDDQLAEYRRIRSLVVAENKP